ncbi:MAG TPA: hypothetical protein VGH49_06500 [Xanthobacteraceae bacterium]
MLATALFWVSLGMSVISFIVFVVLSTRPPPSAASTAGGAAAVERQAGLSDVAKLAEAIAKLVDAFAKAKPSAAAAACSVIFLLIALAAAGIDKSAASTDKSNETGGTHAGAPAGDIDARLNAIDQKFTTRINELEVKLTNRIDDISIKLGARLEQKITTIINEKLETIVHAPTVCTPPGEPAKPGVTQEGCGAHVPITINIDAAGAGAKAKAGGGRRPCGAGPRRSDASAARARRVAGHHMRAVPARVTERKPPVPRNDLRVRRTG